MINDDELVKKEQRLSNKERYGALSEEEYNELMRIRASYERALKRKRRNERIARARRSEELVAKHRVSSKWFRYLAENDIFPKVRG
ncbi:hypothetical protein [Staphylococcus sp. HMSC061G04]|uniref:hypothetical protein n=1 Tax=Staphylococcus sp. HMSC061G04 TaxID=1715208 RepID=UPI0009130466|nr:hypothetical protein [Staphylococcus sp. HMSC061G04]OHP63755.1 hypothetical protein HMPREF2729_08040 [Staphylococcus sp. HMSC061G04]